MSCYLLEKQETYRIDNEKEVDKFLNDLKANQKDYVLTKSSSAYRTRKEKGEIVDSWYKVTVTKSFDNEKFPEYEISGPAAAEEDEED